jgi:hypothetical protein
MPAPAWFRAADGRVLVRCATVERQNVHRRYGSRALFLASSIAVALALLWPPSRLGAAGFDAVFSEAATASIYSSTNLAGHETFPECLGDGIGCAACNEGDAQLEVFASHGACTANPSGSNKFVNALCFKRFVDSFPDGADIGEGVYHYRVEFQLPSTPGPDAANPAIGEAVHVMLLLWGGASNLTGTPMHTQEATLFVRLNPWVDAGAIYVYTDGLTLMPTGITIDLEADRWYVADVYVDFVADMFSVAVDGAGAGPYELASVHQPTWSPDEVAMLITTESENAFPGETCPNEFSWTTRFRNAALRYHDVEYATLDADANGTVQALTDGLLVLRHLFGLSGAALTAGARGTSCTRCSSSSIATNLSSIASQLDVDGNGTAQALTDGLLLLRYLFGLTDSALTTGAIGGGCTRCNAAAVATYLAALE